MTTLQRDWSQYCSAQHAIGRNTAMFNTRLVELVSLTLMHYPDGKVATKVTGV